MNLGEIKTIVRNVSQDLSEYSYLWTDEEIIQYINEGQIEACRNGRILKSTSLSLGEVKSSCQISVLGTFGTISSILIDSVNIITNPITYTSNDNVTASLISNEINETGLFESTVNSSVITLKPLAGFGSYYNNLIPIIVSDNSFATATSFAGGVDGICRIQLKNNVREYNFSSKILKFESWYLGDNQKRLCVKDFRSLNESSRVYSKQKGDVDTVLYGISNNSVYVSNVPNKKDYINMTVYHLPIKTLRNNSDIPEIPEHFHSKLVHYALYKMYMKNDIEAEQLDISNFHYAKFIEEFSDNQFSAASNQYNSSFFYGDC